MKSSFKCPICNSSWQRCPNVLWWHHKVVWDHGICLIHGQTTTTANENLSNFSRTVHSQGHVLKFYSCYTESHLQTSFITLWLMLPTRLMTDDKMKCTITMNTMWIFLNIVGMFWDNLSIQHNIICNEDIVVLRLFTVEMSQNIC